MRVSSKARTAAAASPPPRTGQLIARRTALSGILLGLCAPRPARATTRVRIGGTGSALGALRLLAAAFRTTEAAIAINLLPSLGTGGGLRALQAGVVDLAVTARPLTAGERAAGMQEVEYARTPLIFATGPDIGLRSLSQDEVAQIYAGERAEWPDGTPVRLIRRPPTEAEWEALGALSPAMARAVGLAMRRPGLLTAANDQDNADAIESVPGSFGLLALGQMLSEGRRLNPFTIDGITPADALADLRHWPLVRSLHLVACTRSSAEARAFADFVSGPVAGAVLAGCGHLPIGGGPG